MLDFQQKRKLRSMMYQRTTLIVLGIFVLFAIHSVWSVYSKERESTNERFVVEQKSAELVARDKEIQEKITNIKTEHGIEEEIRTKFSVVKEGENVAIILDSSSTTAPTSTPKTLWQRIVGIFGFK